MPISYTQSIQYLGTADDRRPVWQQAFRGLHWDEMPGSSEEDRKLNFALFRRGLYDPAIDALEAGQSVDAEAEGRVVLVEREDGSVLVRRKRRGRPKKVGVVKRRDEAVQLDIEERTRRQAAVIKRLSGLGKGRWKRITDIDKSGSVMLFRAAQPPTAKRRTALLRSASLDRIEAMLQKAEQQLQAGGGPAHG